MISVVAVSAVSAFGFEWRGLARLAGGPGRFTRSVQLEASHPGIEAGEVPPFPAGVDTADAKARKLMSRGARLAAVAARGLMREGAFEGDEVSAAGFYLAVGASGGAPEELRAMLAASMDEGRFSLARFGREGLAACSPLFAFQLMNNFTLCHAAILEGTRGPNGSYFSRGAGTAGALVEAAQALKSGECERAFAGGADSALHPVTWAELLRAEGAGRVPGEGAALLALEAGPAKALAYLAGAAVVSGRESDPVAQAIAQAEGEDADLVLYSGLGAAAFPKARAIDLTGLFGEAMAATPALGWATAVDALVSGAARRVLVVSRDAEGDAGAAVFASALDSARAERNLGRAEELSRNRGGFRRAGACPPPGHGLFATPLDRNPNQGTDTASVTRLAPFTPSVAERSRGALHSASAPRVLDQARPRAVITGVGVVSAFGIGAEAFFAGLARGACAVGPIHSFDASTFATRVAGEVPGVLGAAELSARLGAPALVEARCLGGALRDRKVAFGLLAAAEAWHHAGCGAAEREASLSIALGLEQAFLEDFAPLFHHGAIDWPAEPRAALPPVRFRSRLDLGARAIGELLALTGPTRVHASACAAGALAVAHAASLIERGAASVVLCGGADSMLNPLGVGGMSRLGAPSARNEADACRPFDRRRDGLVIGEGAAMFVVEDEARAHARGARPLARVLGWGSTQDAYRVTAPRPDGSAACAAMQRALAHAALAPEAVGYVNAHGTGTALNDPAEALAIRAALGAHGGRVPVSSLKGAVGHLMSAAGAIELASCLLAFERDLLPGTANHFERDPECELDVIGPAPRPARVDAVLSNSFGFGGQNACVVLGRPTESARP
jgi:3-oxoacyl-[acyl-carrier-protein] synthase II